MRFAYIDACTALLGLLGLTGCGGKGPGPVVTLPVNNQSIAQQINAHWPAVTAGIALAVLADGANPVVAAAVTKTEGVIGPQIAACAAGTDPTCTASVQASVASFLSTIKLGPKGTLELQVVQGILGSLVPGVVIQPPTT